MMNEYKLCIIRSYMIACVRLQLGLEGNVNDIHTYISGLKVRT